MEKLEILERILALRHLKTIRSSFLNAPIDEDGRLRTSFSLVETGRLSSHEDELGRGSHLQNVPPEIRKMFVPDDGYVLIEADKKQGEVMIVAWLAHEERMKEVFRAGGDIHQFNADNLGWERSKAKTRTHGWDYGLGARTNEEKKAREKYFKTYPRIIMWQEEIKQQLTKTRMLTNCFGRKRLFFERFGNSLWQEGYAFIPQSTLVDDVNRGLIELFFMGEPVIQILHQGHDSVLCQVMPENLAFAKALMKVTLEKSFVCGGELLTIPVEIKTGANWGEMKGD